MEIEEDKIECSLLAIADTWEEEGDLREICLPVMECIDPTMETICIKRQDRLFPKNRKSKTPITPSTYDSDINANLGRIVTQSFGITVLLGESQCFQTQEIEQKIQREPWRLHHTMQLLNWNNWEITAKQNFYELHPELFLLSVSTMSEVKNVIRINIFVKNMVAMKNFYGRILQKLPNSESETYCCFLLETTDQYEVQLSLKMSKQLDIVKTERVALVFKGPFTLPRSKKSRYGKRTLKTKDPEGNSIILIDTSVETFTGIFSSTSTLSASSDNLDSNCCYECLDERLGSRCDYECLEDRLRHRRDYDSGAYSEDSFSDKWSVESSEIDKGEVTEDSGCYNHSLERNCSEFVAASKQYPVSPYSEKKVRFQKYCKNSVNSLSNGVVRRGDMITYFIGPTKV